ncbi:MAG: DUF6624 domain-containing protein [Phocaeicola sp.]|uniref:DUF6624 domain-containing protein n=1 Tax=Phocaeicola TaxID=909656 RepID=UPI00234EAEFC|nr:DUF6624 domain-containing protein [Phocaeicola oris]MCE2616180.1 hypothetical protein [Phocaeicola oris]
MHNIRFIISAIFLYFSFSVAIPAQSTKQLGDNEQYTILIAKADSCYMRQNYEDAKRFFASAFQIENCVQNNHLYNAACVYALTDDKDGAYYFLNERLKRDTEWYISDFDADKDLMSLHEDSRWAVFANEMLIRKTKHEADYDIPLRKELLEIGRSDQCIRYELMAHSQRHADDKAMADSLFKVLLRVDSLNQKKICNILDTRGFVGKDKVGEACEVFWLVIQHSPVELQKKYLSQFRIAADKGEIAQAHVAMMEDRINVFEGKPQKYGSQLKEGNDGKMRLYKLQNPAKVDEWRKSVGMIPLAEYLQTMGIVRGK